MRTSSPATLAITGKFDFPGCSSPSSPWRKSYPFEVRTRPPLSALPARTRTILGLVSFLAVPSPVAGDDYVIGEEVEHKARAQALHDAALEMAMRATNDPDSC